ncbi:39S ribosomal protein L18, mitochondrial-like [Centruroides sculpturatus]|uniref:39S ribosomal protein L18, mitochondrial-like n=1 Tax=Centruroides sculpturatus TaxID=218467 RepID=UPI000C6D364D|nr:39S ribosomal protein L18, mitochondrial-like [Centruroides sculpturatus]
MFLARKPSGYGLEMINKSYWHKLELKKSSRYVTGNVVHNSGEIIISASSKEWGISKQLYSNTDLCAVENIGRVLAQRCLESGILFVYCDFTEEELASNRIKIFLKALEEGGVTLSEPDQIKPRQHPDL